MYSQRPIRGRFCTTLRHVPHGSGDNQEFLSRPRAQPLSCFDTPWGVGGAPDDGRKLGHWRRASATEGRTRRDSSLASRSCRAAAASTRAPFLTRWTSTPSWPVDPRSRSSTNSRTPTSRDRATRSAGRTSTSCSTPGSTSSPPSTSSTWSRSTTPSPRSRASSSRRRSPTRSSAPPTRSTSSTCRPEALRRRMAHGNVYRPEKVDAALANYFRVGNLSALRELALLWLADKVDAGLEGYRATHGITEQWPTRERVVVALSGGPEGETLLRRGARIASRLAGGQLLAVLRLPHRRPGQRPAQPGRRAATPHRGTGRGVPHRDRRRRRARRPRLRAGGQRDPGARRCTTPPAVAARIRQEHGGEDHRRLRRHRRACRAAPVRNRQGFPTPAGATDVAPAPGLGRDGHSAHPAPTAHLAAAGRPLHLRASPWTSRSSCS